MEHSQSYTVQLTLEQKELFDAWLNAAQAELEAKLESMKSLRKQVLMTPKVTKIKSKSLKIKPDNKSWTSKAMNALRQLGGAQTSGQIISWLMENDAELTNKEKRYVTKNVTSKLVILVDGGRMEKKNVAGKNVYLLKDQI